jgi:hypothetical protein
MNFQGYQHIIDADFPTHDRDLGMRFDSDSLLVEVGNGQEVCPEFCYFEKKQEFFCS